MTLTRLDNQTYLNLTSLAFVLFEDMNSEPKASLRFSSGVSEMVTGENAVELQSVLATSFGMNTQSAHAVEETLEHRPPEIPIGYSIPAMMLTRNKAWFYRVHGNGEALIMAFVNAKGSCSIRTFDAGSGIFLSRHYRAGNYHEQFAELINGAIELSVSEQPNLERDCKERLPQNLFTYLRSQFA